MAAVNGLAIGGAAELTLCFDRRVGSTDTSYRFPENAMGFTISHASSILLPRLVGAPTAWTSSSAAPNSTQPRAWASVCSTRSWNRAR
ncbi:hypothetical protein AB0L71_21235 [Streptomyces sp. NPDC052052]|uniref:hypothetical protein n=1 Tax=Streptomyces sp. NPDC052052 TaxID=3154756 RepID=UPI003415A37E